jgi:glycerophosphoryl diester phosphodiesterase
MLCSSPSAFTPMVLISLLACVSAESLQAQIIVAHRGASYDAPENTIAAFKEAWKQNADGVEGDFYVIRDQQIVCIHDANTERTGGRKLDSKPIDPCRLAGVGGL